MQTPMPSRKQQHEAVTPASSAKRTQASHGAIALQTMANSITQFSNAVAAALAPPTNAVDPTPRRHADAIRALYANEKWMDKCQVVKVIDLFRKDTTACDVYLSIASSDDRDLCEEWIKAQLEVELNPFN